MKKFIASTLLALNLHAAFPSWYYNIHNPSKQKKAFVEILLPLIKDENNKILQTRRKIIEIFKDPYFLLDPQKIAFLAKIAKKYKIKDITNEKEFLLKVDAIPPSLALAQAAVESGWGKSRFAKKANNLFGYWEYSDNGIKPKSKYDYIKINYSLKVFPSLEDSIATYMLNLNRNPAYKSFRKLRALYRKEHKVFTGKVAAKTLLYYSQKREAYIKTLQSLIKNNDWSKYDNLSY